MAIAYDTSTVATAYASTGTQTTSHAGSASSRAAVVMIAQNGTVNDEVSGVTYAGVAMNRLRFDTESTEAGGVYIYWLDGVATGTQNVAMTTTASTNKQLVVATMTVASGTVVSVVGTGNTGTSTGASNPALTLTGLTNGVAYSAYEVIHSGLQTMTNTPANSFNLISSTDLGSQGRGFAYRDFTASGTTQAAGWTASTSDDYVISGVAFTEDSVTAYTGGASNTTETVTLAAGGFVGYVQGASTLTATVTTYASGTVPLVRDITERAVFKLGPNPAAAYTGGASALTETVTLAATGARGVTTGGSLTATVTLSAAGATGVATGGSQFETVTLSATGVAAVTGSAGTLTGTVSLSASGLVARFGSASLTETVTLSASGGADKAQGSNLSESVATTAAGSANLTGGGSLSVTALPSGAGVSELYDGGSLSVSVSSAASVSALADVALTETVVTSAAGVIAMTGVATAGVTVTVNATGSVSRQLTAQLSVAVGTAAAGIRQGYLLKQPTTEQVYTNILPFARFGIDTGQTIILKNGVITVTDYPYQDELNDADAYYLGGHVYSLTQAEAQALIAAGGSQYVEEL